jgi:hypothetical protein
MIQGIPRVGEFIPVTHGAPGADRTRGFLADRGATPARIFLALLCCEIRIDIGLGRKENEDRACGNKIGIASTALAVLGLFAFSLHGDEGRHSGSWREIVIDVACDARTLVVDNVSPTDSRMAR